MVIQTDIQTSSSAAAAAAAAAAPPLLEIRALGFGRNDAVLFQDLDFSLAAGQLLLIEGDNGSGKTTLLRLLCGLLEPWSGVIRWRGEDIRNCYPGYLRSLSYVGHANAVKHGLTPRENLSIARDLAAVNGRPDLDSMLRRFGLDRYLDTPVQSLSAGQRRRAALARLLFPGKALWILDEPLTSLDAASRGMIGEIFREHLAAGGAIAMTSHDPFSLEGTDVTRLRL